MNRSVYKMTRAAVSATVCALTFTLAIATSHADDDVVAAANAFAKAQKEELAGNFRRAAHLYELADQIAPSAQALRSATRARFAADDAAIAATHAAALRRRYPGDALSKRVAKRVLNKLRGKLGMLTIRCKSGCTIAIDRRAATTRQNSSHVIFVNPGKHRVSARFGEGRVRDKRVRARAGSSTRLAFQPPRPEAPPRPLADAKPDVSVEPSPPPPSPRPPSGLRTRWFWTAAVVSAGLGAAALWSGLDTLNHRDAYERNPTQTGYNDGVALELRTNVLLGATAAAGITTLLIALNTRWHTPVERLGVQANAGGVMLSLGGGF